MEVYVEPAKRAGRKKLIRKAPIAKNNIIRDDDAVMLSFEAEGIYDKSRYRYTIRLTRDSLATLQEILV